jgi:hypothetical protein
LEFTVLVGDGDGDDATVVDDGDGDATVVGDGDGDDDATVAGDGDVVSVLGRIEPQLANRNIELVPSKTYCQPDI